VSQHHQLTIIADRTMTGGQYDPREKMQLYTSDWSLYPRRVAIYLAEKGIEDIELVSIDLIQQENHQPAFLALNPLGRIPILITPEIVICQSTSILEYLEEKYPSPNMLGNTPEARAVTRDLMYMVNECYVCAINYFGHASAALAARFEQKADAATAFYTQYRQAISAIEQTISDNDFLCGKHPTIADCMMFASAQYVHRLYGEPLPIDCPKLNAFYVRFEQRPSAAIPEYPKLLGEIAPPPSRPNYSNL
jgi:glutathione S-transferase